MKDRSIYAFVILIILSGLLSYIISDLLVTEDLVYEAFNDRLSDERIEELLNIRQERSWYGYLFQPVKYLLKFLVVSVCLYTGAFFFNYETSFLTLYKICIRAEFIFLIPVALKVFWFLFVDFDYNLQDMRSFAPLSLFNIFSSDDFDPWLIYLLKSINLFKLFYMLFLANEFSNETGGKISKSLKVIAISYGMGWLLWITFALFLIVSFS